MSFFFALFFALPFLIPLDPFKHKIQAAFSEKVNADLDFSSAKITILTGLGLELKDVVIQNKNPKWRPIIFLRASEIKLGLDIFSLFQGKMFFQSLKIHHLQVVTQPENQYPGEFSQVNLKVTNLGMDRDMEVFFETFVKLDKAPFSMEGPLAGKLIVHLQKKDETIQLKNLNGLINLNRVKLSYQNIFLKSNGVPFSISFQGEGDSHFLKLKEYTITLQDLIGKGSFYLTDFKKQNLDFQMHLFAQDVSKLGEIFPLHQKFFSEGEFDINFFLKGALSDLKTLQSKLKVNFNLAHSFFHLSCSEDSLAPISANFQFDSQQFNLSAFLNPILGNDARKKIDLVQKPLLFSNVLFKGSVANQVFKTDHLGFDLFGGRVDSQFITHFDHTPAFTTGDVVLKKMALDKMYSFFHGISSPIKGVVDAKLKFTAKGNSLEDLSHSLNGPGYFWLKDGEIQMENLAKIALYQLAQLSKQLGFPSLVLSETQLQQIGLSTVMNKSLGGSQGPFQFIQGKLNFMREADTEEGKFKWNLLVGLDNSLSGWASYVASKVVQSKVLAQNRHLSFLLNQKGCLELILDVTGTMEKPFFLIKLGPLKQNFTYHTQNKFKQFIENQGETKKLQENLKKFINNLNF